MQNVITNCEAAVTADLTVHSINLIGDLLCEESLDLSKVMKSFFIIFVPSFVVFIGSRNATTESKKILAKFPDLKFINLTSRLTFAQSVEVARCARVLFCCDGGLFHGASAMSANIIVLLARLSSEMLLTKNNLARTLYDSNYVNNIPVDCLLREFNQVL